MFESERKATLLSIIVEDFSENTKSLRVDHYLAQRADFPSRSQIKQWLEKGLVCRNGQALSASDQVRPGDKLEIQKPEQQEIRLEPREIPLSIFHEDEDLVVVYKPRGLSMHPGASHSDEDTLVHALLYHFQTLSNFGGMFRPGIVHRLDKDTEGLVVVAKNNETHEDLSKQFSERSVKRRYWALAWGKLPQELEIDAPIARHRIDRKKMGIDPKGRASQSLFRLKEYFPKENFSWIECQLKTGRTHQIRVHAEHKKFPLLADDVYGLKKAAVEKHLQNFSEKKREAYRNLKGQALVAFELGFVHPQSQKSLCFEAEKPQWLKSLTEA